MSVEGEQQGGFNRVGGLEREHNKVDSIGLEVSGVSTARTGAH